MRTAATQDQIVLEVIMILLFQGYHEFLLHIKQPHFSQVLVPHHRTPTNSLLYGATLSQAGETYKRVFAHLGALLLTTYAYLRVTQACKRVEIHGLGEDNSHFR